MPASVGRFAVVLKTGVYVFDSDADPVLIHLRRLSENVRTAIPPVDSPSLIDVRSRPMRLLASLFLFVRVGQFRACIQFIVVASMIVNCMPRRIFIYRRLKADVRAQRKIVLLHAPVVAFLSAKKATTEVFSVANRTSSGAVNGPPTS